MSALKDAIKAAPDDLASYISDVETLNGTSFNFKVALATHLTDLERRAIWDILSTNMRDFYLKSSFGWNPKSKKKELFHRLGRFILVRLTANLDDPVVAFTTFRFENEDGYQVIYCYEIQITDAYRRHGLGRKLMEFLWKIGRQKRLDKVMLTVFKVNETAINFYETMGFAVDPSSPGYTPPSEEWVDDDDGDNDECDYEILSKSFVQSENVAN